MTKRAKPTLPMKELLDKAGEDAVSNRFNLPSAALPFSTLIRLLRQAKEEVPALKYALGVVGLAAAGGIIGLIVGFERTSIVLFALMFVGMIILFLFSVLVRKGSSYSVIIAANVLLWTVVIVFCASLLLGLIAMVFKTPKGLYEFLNPRAQLAEQVQRADIVASALVQLCSSGPIMTSHFDPQNGRLSGDNFVVERQDARQVVDTISTRLNNLAFNQNDRTRECMRQFIQTLTGVNLDETVVSARENKNFKGIPVTYYQKLADGSRITSALARRGIKFTIEAPAISDRFETNTIRCSPGSPPLAIKEVALAILENGGSIHVVERIYGQRSDTAKDIYILARATFGGERLVRNPLSRAQIAAISECPPERLSNLPTFEPPRPTGRPDDMRFVSFFLDKNWNIDGQLTAAHFCKLRGHTDAVLYREAYTENEDDVVVHLGDHGMCNGPRCRYFTKIICY